MKTKTLKCVALTLSLMMAVAALPRIVSSEVAPVVQAEERTSGTLTEDEANALLAAAGTSVVEIAIENKLWNVNTDAYGDCGGSRHLQGICVDENLEYMYFAYTTNLAKIDMRTGELVASVLFGTDLHVGCLEYFDGHVYASMPGNGRSYLGIFDVGEMTEVGVNVSELMENKVVSAVLLADPTNDHQSASINPELFVGQTGDANGRRFACSAFDGVTVGKYPGGTDDELYLIIAYGMYGRGEWSRYDNTYTILKFYKMTDIWQEEGNTWNIPFDEERMNAEIRENEMLSAAKTLYLFTGNMFYGVQNLEYEWDTGDIGLYTYRSIDGFGDSMYVVDGSKEPTLKTLELGQNTTLPKKAERMYAKWVADSYAEDVNGNGFIDEDEYLKGYVGEFKCLCGRPESHLAESVGDETWGYTGVKKSEQMICSCSGPMDATTGIAWFGADPEDATADYFYCSNSSTGSRIYRRYVKPDGTYAFQWIKFEE